VPAVGNKELYLEEMWKETVGFRIRFQLYFYSGCLYYFERVRISQMSIIN